ncbi:YicC-like family%2C N-terminal region [uncultured Clostridium sp.]|uniref:YicC/YloC family endoribonuclease n=1 Tax=uncultured Clostridium sp. TaxID=59620 RepID=UPI000820CD29|nr:YicC/YloC family endoribonuclease [uncultured Clostridium sp.]SCJ49440.1 YicC-like family%2C N-terminal region [uncultured Clostridium sp.]
MVKSMTSFGRSSSEEGQKRIFTVEMKSVNNRYLDINIRMPKALISLEEEVRKMISSSLSRGKVDIFINLKNYSQNEGTPKIDLKLAEDYLNCLKQIEENFGLKNDVSVMQLARFPEVITMVQEEEKIEEIFEELKPLISKSIEMMICMRIAEGEKLKEDILDKVTVIENLVKEIEKVADTIPKAYKIKLEERLSELLSGADVDQNRLATEVCIFADKATVDEEITRLGSHISQIRKTLSLDEPIGRKLDFIIQEMNRETNTIGSKSSDIHMTNLVIDIKNLIEKIREQVQNIE